jgi:IclR family KDG regulon transcriptional repressor
MDGANDKYILQSVGNALDILDLLTEHEELSVPEVSRLTGLGKSSVFRLLATLESRNYVRKTENAKYRLDIKLTAMGNTVLNRMEIINYAHPHLMELTRVSGETSHLVIWDRGTNVRFVDKVLSSSMIRMDSWVGFCRTAHLLGSGKALLAFQSEQFRRTYMNMVDFSPMTPNSIVTAARLEEVLAQIREQGYACDDEESEIGLYCLAAPIRDMNGDVVAAVSISGPAERMKENRDKNIALVKQTALDITRSIS